MFYEGSRCEGRDDVILTGVAPVQYVEMHDLNNRPVLDSYFAYAIYCTYKPDDPTLSIILILLVVHTRSITVVQCHID